MGEGLSRKQAQQQTDAERWESMGKPCLAKHGNIESWAISQKRWVRAKSRSLKCQRLRNLD